MLDFDRAEAAVEEAGEGPDDGVCDEKAEVYEDLGRLDWVLEGGWVPGLLAMTERLLWDRKTHAE